MKKPTDHAETGRNGSRRTVFALGGGMLLALCAAISLPAQDDQPVGRLLPSTVPADLQEALPELDNNWQSWSESLAADLEKLYAAQPLDESAQTALIDGLKSRLKVIETSLADPRYRSIERPLRNVYGKLSRRVAVIEAALDTLKLPPEARTAKLKSESEGVIRAVGELEEYLKPMKNGEGWLRYVGVDGVKTALDSGDVASLKSLADRFEAAEKMEDETIKNFIARNPFQAVRANVANYVTIASATATVADTPEVRRQLSDLIAALEAYEAEPSSASAADVRKNFQALRGSTVDGGDRIAQALRANYFNYNLKVAVTEDFANRFFKESRQETGPVRDYILSARVSGNQVTHTDVSLDFKPDASQARFEIKLAGRTNSSTQGVTDQATIYTAGRHYFWAAKPVLFDGDRFTTEKATISVNANNYTQGARTGFSGVPLFGGLADGIAVSEARKKKAQSEAIARGRVSGKVLPRLNKEVDEEFAKANTDLEQNTISSLKELGIYPDAKTYRTTEDQLTIHSRLMADGELGAGAPYAVEPPKEGMSVQVHESLINNSLDRMELAGKVINEDELKVLFEERLRKLLGDDFKFPEPEQDADYDADEDGPATLMFADSDPIRVEISNGLLIIRLRAGVQREDDDDIPTQNITIFVKFRIDEEGIHAEREGGIRVEPVEKPESGVKQISFGLIIKGIFQRATPPRVFNAKHTVDYKEKKVDLTISKVEALDGWMTVEVQ